MDIFTKLFDGITTNIWVVAGMTAVCYARNMLVNMPAITGIIRDARLRSALFEGTGDVVKHELYGIIADKTHHNT